MSDMAAEVPAARDVPDIPVLRALGNRRSIRYFDADRVVEDWKLEAMLQDPENPYNTYRRAGLPPGVVNVVTADSWADPDLGWVDLSIDSDKNFATGCFGVDHYYIAWYELDGTQFFSSVRTPNCDFNTWTDLSEVVGLARSASNQVTMVIQTPRFQSVPQLRWQSSITHLDENDPIDFLPDGFLDEGGFKTAPGNPCGGRCFWKKCLPVMPSG